MWSSKTENNQKINYFRAWCGKTEDPVHGTMYFFLLAYLLDIISASYLFSALIDRERLRTRYHITFKYLIYENTHVPAKKLLFFSKKGSAEAEK